MKYIKVWITVCLLGLTVACSKGMKDQLLGTDQESSDSGAGTTPVSEGSVDDQLMVKVASDILAIFNESGEQGFSSAPMAACVPGNISTSSVVTTYAPQVYGSSRVYTVNGISYFSGNFHESSGGRLTHVTTMNGTCISNTSTYGTLSLKGSSYMQWFSGPGSQVQYRNYYYTYDYKYRGDILIIEGYYTINTETSSTKYPVKFTINI
jgi:hypothetical protein